MSMFEVSRVSAEVGGKEISFETGKLAKQASGAVVVRAGDTMVLCTATAGNDRDVDFLPLTVDVEERHYAAGKIPGSFFRREARAGEKATLTARMIDRPIRPLFPKGWHRETQLVCQPMSVDHVHPYDILAMNGASAALAISEIPVEQARRLGPGRQARRRLRRQPRGGAPRGARARPDRRRHRRGDPDGRGRCQRRHRAGDPRRARHRPHRDQEADRAPSRSCAARPARRRSRSRSPKVDEELLDRSRDRTARSSTRRPRSRASSSARTRSTRSRPRWSSSTRPPARTTRPTASAPPRSRPPSRSSRRT